MTTNILDTVVMWIPRILIIDDNPAIHEDFRKVLSGKSPAKDELKAIERALFSDPKPSPEPEWIEFELDSAFQGAEGLSKIQAAHQEQRPYAMAFVDVRMPPGWDGVETVSRIWEQFPDLQVVICSAYSDYQWHEIRSRLKHRENLLILKKPFDADEVIQIALALTEKCRLAKAATANLEQLENVVEQRTKDLQLANQELQRQIAQRERAEQHLRNVAFHDSLTGLPNRRKLQNSLQSAIDYALANCDHTFAVLFVDVDRFKSINDQFGHEVGDQLLKQFAERITGSLRESDAVVSDNLESITGRLGGDEFVVVIGSLKNQVDAERIADRLLEALRKPYQFCEQDIHVRPSIGIVLSNPQYSLAAEMLRDADTAIYEAKSRGGDRYVVFDVLMQSAIQHRLTIERALYGALEYQQFFLAYQPIWGVADGKLQGVESLLRWNHPELGLIPPDEFIPIAEQTKLIIPIGEWVLREACRQLQQWKQQFRSNAPPYISVNLSRLQLLQPGLVDLVRSTLESSGMESRELQIEVTESLIMEDAQKAGQMLADLKALGVRLAIDDFGTGHSSLACLYEFHFDVLKIDRSFISHINDGKANSELIVSIVRLAKNLGLGCIAEGVEFREQLSQLGNMGCPSIQGYLVGKPKSGNDIIQDLENANLPFGGQLELFNSSASSTFNLQVPTAVDCNLATN
ncbi:MAG TPA: EAL domain-containing protein [Pirellulaceae bacterium]|nr:EAL domain-containing protein [Pirellulaceae bacterium]HMO93990.1 EAL domain-containing protein [Pirellulaceae bacterium]HMP70854.1 EAL domain-containing protein [Pirellulaceae bacterium]